MFVLVCGWGRKNGQRVEGGVWRDLFWVGTGVFMSTWCRRRLMKRGRSVGSLVGLQQAPIYRAPSMIASTRRAAFALRATQ